MKRETGVSRLPNQGARQESLAYQTIPRDRSVSPTATLRIITVNTESPRRLRLAVEHLCQYRGGICFCVDLDPRWVVKVIKKGWMDHLKAYQEHVIDQVMTILSAGHDIKCMFSTPKLLDALVKRLEEK